MAAVLWITRTFLRTEITVDNQLLEAMSGARSHRVPQMGKAINAAQSVTFYSVLDWTNSSLMGHHACVCVCLTVCVHVTACA